MKRKTLTLLVLVMLLCTVFISRKLMAACWRRMV
jgi:hypothetical protein